MINNICRPIIRAALIVILCISTACQAPNHDQNVKEVSKQVVLLDREIFQDDTIRVGMRHDVAMTIALEKGYYLSPLFMMSILRLDGSAPRPSFCVSQPDGKALIVSASPLVQDEPSFVAGLTIVEGAGRAKMYRKSYEVNEIQLQCYSVHWKDESNPSADETAE